MSNYKECTVRHLGSMRHQVLESKTLQTSAKLDKTYEGISGSALPVPLKLNKKEQRLSEINVKEEPRTLVPIKVHSSSNIILKKSNESNNIILDTGSRKIGEERTKNSVKEVQEYKEKEKQLLKKIAAMQLLIDKQALELKDKQQFIELQRDDLETKIISISELLINEKNEHARCQEELQETRKILLKETQQAESIKSQLKIQILEISNELKMQQAEYTKKHSQQDADILLRDDKFERLKKQMADALMGNSKERQQQLDELSKELQKVQEDANLLRSSLRSLKKSSKENCTNCEKLHMKIINLDIAVREKDQQISVLNCRLYASGKLLQLDST